MWTSSILKFYVFVLEHANTVSLLMQSGKLCLCKYVMPPFIENKRLLSGMDVSETNNTINDLKLVNLIDDVEGRINVILSNGQVCTRRYSLSSTFAATAFK